MLVWLNGAFGVGKTTTARLIGETDPRWRFFDPEWVGYMLRANLADRLLGGDFQHLEAWRRLVPVVAREIGDVTGQELVAVQTVLVERYWRELLDGLHGEGFHVLHVLLDAAPDALRLRIEDDSSKAGIEARKWRLEHVHAFAESRGWMTTAADVVVDTSSASPEEVVASILLTAGQRS